MAYIKNNGGQKNSASTKVRNAKVVSFQNVNHSDKALCSITVEMMIMALCIIYDIHI